MGRQRFRTSDERGFAFAYLAVFMVGLLLFIGLAVDSGRAYVVKAQLSKAVDGAALGAARMLNSGDPEAEAEQIFNANFPVGFMGTTSVAGPGTANFFKLETIPETGVNVVTVTASATLPTTFMKLGTVDQVTVTSTGEAQRRMVDLSLVLDVSSSIGSKWGAVRDAVRTFIDAFDENADRLALVTYSNGAKVISPMPASRGFDKAGLKAAVPNTLPGGSTAMVEGLYRGWDELRSVPNGQQSGLRVIVLFTDGASNSVPGIYDSSGQAKGLRTYDFPKNWPDPDNQTWDNPTIAGLYHTQTGSASPSVSKVVNWQSTATISSVPLLPANSFHQYRRSPGIPSSFPLVSSSITVNGMPQHQWRPLTGTPVGGRFPAHVQNVNNAARNLLEIIANAVRSDTGGDYPIRIYTIGMGELVRYHLGSRQETSESILMRVANDRNSPDFNSAQLAGRYYYAQTEADVGPAFQQLQNQIIRLTK